MAIFPHLVVAALAFPLAYAGGFVGKLAGALVGMSTTRFGLTWLDVAVSTSGQGCLIGVIVGVILP